MSDRRQLQRGGAVLIWKSTWNDEAIHEMGWMILPEFQRRGIAGRAVQSILHRADEQDAFDAIHAFPSVDNAASNRICEKSGFNYAGNSLCCNHWRIEFDS